MQYDGGGGHFCRTIIVTCKQLKEIEIYTLIHLEWRYLPGLFKQRSARLGWELPDAGNTIYSKLLLIVRMLLPRTQTSSLHFGLRFDTWLIHFEDQVKSIWVRTHPSYLFLRFLWHISVSLRLFREIEALENNCRQINIIQEILYKMVYTGVCL